MNRAYRPRRTAPALERLEPRVFLDATPPRVYVPAQPEADGRGRAFIDVLVSYSDDLEGDTGIDLSTLGDGDVVVTGPNGYSAAATFVPPSRVPYLNSSVTGRYRVPAPGGALDEADNGTYVIEAVPGVVADLAGNATVRDSNQPGALWVGTISVNVPPQDGPDLLLSAAEPVTPVIVHRGKERQVRPPLRVTLTNVGNAPARGTARIFDFAGFDDDVVGELPRAKVDLAPGESRTFRLKNKLWTRFDRPAWDIDASVEADAAVDRWTGNNRLTFGRYEVIPAPYADLQIGPPTLTASGGGALRAGHKAVITFPVTNSGNRAAIGRVVANIDLVLKPTDATGHGGNELPATIHARPGSAGTGRIVLKLPRTLGGDRYYVAIQYLKNYPWPVLNADSVTLSSMSTEAVEIEPAEGA